MTLLKPLLAPLLLGPAPALDLDFTVEELDPRIVYVRLSDKTYFDADGLLKTAPMNVWPREFDPLTGECLGRSFWNQRTNLCTVSEDITSNQWGKANAIVTANQAVDPTGATAMGLYEASANGSRITHLHNGLNLTGHAGSVFLKKATSRYVTFALSLSTSLANAVGFVFDLDTGTVVAQTTNGTGLSTLNYVPFVQRLPNGIYRVGQAANLTSGSAIYLFIAPHGTAPANITTGTAGESVYVWGGMLEVGRDVSNYISVPSTAGITRSAEKPYIFDLSTFGHSSQHGTWAIDFHAINLGTSASTTVALSYGDGTSGGFLSLVSVDGRGIISGPTAALPGGIGNYAEGQLARVAFTVAQNGANIDCRQWSNRPFGPATGVVTNKQLSGYSYLGLGGRSRGGGSNDAEMTSTIKRIRYWPFLLTDAELAGLAG